MSLSADQSKAFKEIKEFLKSNDFIHTLSGFAGTGKTFLSKHIFAWAQENNITVAGIAPTHKARKILESFLNTATFLPANTMTVASFLYKIKQHSYVGSKNYKGNGRSRAAQFDFFLIDECSMISDKDVDEIVAHIRAQKKKALFIGDRAQIPNPVQKYSKNKDGTISKKDSKSFDFPTSTLTTIIRQTENNPLLEIYTEIRKDLFKEPNIIRENNVVDGKGLKFYTDAMRFKAKIKRDLEKLDNKEELLNYKVITYTNDSVRDYNKYVRGLLGHDEKFVVGDLLMGYNNVGFPIPIIENGQEYFVVNIQKVSNYPIKFYKDCYDSSGHVLKLYIVGTEQGHISIFLPTITSPENKHLLHKLKELATRVNMKNSTTEDFKKYCHLKNQLIFMENVYEYDGKVVSESQLKDNHPKLFNSSSYYVDVNGGKLSLKDTKSTQKMLARYPGLLEHRVSDKKTITDSERLVDRYQLIDKDVDYGYGITSHKAQGSTYHTVYIDEINFLKIGNRWNPFYEAEENGTKERNQLKYVAYTRPTDVAAVLYSD